MKKGFDQKAKHSKRDPAFAPEEMTSGSACQEYEEVCHCGSVDGEAVNPDMRRIPGERLHDNPHNLDKPEE